MKILIVDDSRTARMILRSQIPQQEMVSILEAGNGKEALEIYLKEKPEITFLDLTMPVMDGYEALEEIHKAVPEALVIVLSADIQKKAMERVTALGAFKFIKKPPNPNDIQQALTEAITELRNRS